MQTKVYIKSSAAISPFQEVENELFDNSLQGERIGNKAISIEPNYKSYIKPIKARRMSRALKMNWVAANIALQRAKISTPAMINVATGMGCQADTIKFLEQLIENNEEYLKPTAFINSTHNTLAGYLAIELKCKGQNFTFTHNDLNFEHALLDSILRLENSETKNVLVGGVDEITEQSHGIMEQMKILCAKNLPQSKIFDNENIGYINGEGAAFFVIDNDKENAIAKLVNLSLEYNVSSHIELAKAINNSLIDSDINIADIGLIIDGSTGNSELDKIIKQFVEQQKLSSKTIKYKHISGENMSVSGLGMWLGTNIIKEQTIPSYFEISNITNINNVLIINHNQQNNYSIILLQKT